MPSDLLVVVWAQWPAWAEVSLRAVRADDPLAFGVERLRDARTTYRKDLDRLVKGLPPDRRDALATAEADLHRKEEMLRHAERALLRSATAPPPW